MTQSPRARSRERLYAALSPNGHFVHLANREAQAACGQDLGDMCVVRARITCKRCATKRPKKAARLVSRPLVIGINHEPYYAALGRALRGGATEEPHVRVKFWPVIA